MIENKDGQPPGLPQYELMRDPLAELLADAGSYAAAQFTAHGGTLSEALPLFGYGLLQARARANPAHYLREEMPVIEEEDLEDLKVALAGQNLADVCDVCTIQPWGIIPTQRQIYVDKSIDGTARAGVEATTKFLLSNHVVISQDSRLIDGHHRWLTAFMINPSISLPAFRVRAPLDALLGVMLQFSDARHKRNG